MNKYASLGIVAMLAVSFAVLASTAGSGQIAIAVGVSGFVIVTLLWLLYRQISLHATLSRCVAMGNPSELLALLAENPRQLLPMKGTMPLAIYRAMALEQQGEFAKVLEVFDGLTPLHRISRWQSLIEFVKAGVLAELGKSSEAADRLRQGEALPQTESTALLRVLTSARVSLCKGDRAGAKATLAPLPKHMRLGPAQRAIALYYLSKCEDSQEQAQQWLQQAQKLAPQLWFSAPQ